MLNPTVDAYIAKSAPFARPILKHLRALIHTACPEVVEEIKWSRPFFSHSGVILCNISAFKSHCSVGFWGAEMGRLLRKDDVLQSGAMGSFGRITSLADLPTDKQLCSYFRKAAAFIEAGQGENRIVAARRVVKAPRPPLELPPEFTAALQQNGMASAFAALSPSCRREYIEWITSAKQSVTRERRIAQAIPWIAAGKHRNWQYQAK